MESGSNDPCAYMLTVAFISISQGSASPGNIAILIVKQLAFGIIFGVLIAKLSSCSFDIYASKARGLMRFSWWELL